MQQVRLGKTEIIVSKNGFGALPIQRISKKEAVYLLQKAFYNGINYFDTARAYSDSEEKMGAALSYIREKLIISTKTAAQNAEDFRKDLETSLRNLKTDYILLKFSFDKLSPYSLGILLFSPNRNINCIPGLLLNLLPYILTYAYAITN